MVGDGGRMLHCGALAKAAGVSPDTIRHYERIGVLRKAERTASGYRVYRESDVERVLVVRRALRIGFTLAELTWIMGERDAGGIPCGKVYQLACRKLEQIESDIQAMRRTQRYLRKLLTDWQERMKHSGHGNRAHLLHSLSDEVRNSIGSRNRLGRRKR